MTLVQLPISVLPQSYDFSLFSCQGAVGYYHGLVVMTAHALNTSLLMHSCLVSIRILSSLDNLNKTVYKYISDCRKTFCHIVTVTFMKGADYVKKKV